MSIVGSVMRSVPDLNGDPVTVGDLVIVSGYDQFYISRVDYIWDDRSITITIQDNITVLGNIPAKREYKAETFHFVKYPDCELATLNLATNGLGDLTPPSNDPFKDCFGQDLNVGDVVLFGKDYRNQTYVVEELFSLTQPSIRIRNTANPMMHVFLVDHGNFLFKLRNPRVWPKWRSSKRG